jgi:hypothetical protein
VACATASTLLRTASSSLPLRRESRQVSASVRAALAQVCTLLRCHANRGPSAPSPTPTAGAAPPPCAPSPRSRLCCRGCRRTSCWRGRHPPPARRAPGGAGYGPPRLRRGAACSRTRPGTSSTGTTDARSPPRPPGSRPPRHQRASWPATLRHRQWPRRGARGAPQRAGA